MSTEPSTRLIVPSDWTVAITEEAPVLFRQKPVAMPRPRLGPPSGAV